MNIYTLLYKDIKMEIPFDSLTSQLQRQGLEVFLPHELNSIRKRDRLIARQDELHGVIKGTQIRLNEINDFFDKLETKLIPDLSSIKIGDKMLYKNHNYPDEPDQWIEFIVNETYLGLMKEFPEEYRYLNGTTLNFKI